MDKITELIKEKEELERKIIQLNKEENRLRITISFLEGIVDVVIKDTINLLEKSQERKGTSKK